MPRLLRPNIDLETKLRVLLRQLGEFWPDGLIEEVKKKRELGKMVEARSNALAQVLNCEVSALHLDHDPPLGARRKVYDADGNHIDYDPPANDPDHLIYRERRAHFEKTHIRGERGQLSDWALIKKNRRLERREAEAAGLMKPKRKAKIAAARKPWPSRPFPKRQRFT